MLADIGTSFSLKRKNIKLYADIGVLKFAIKIKTKIK